MHKKKIYSIFLALNLANSARFDEDLDDLNIIIILLFLAFV